MLTLFQTKASFSMQKKVYFILTLFSAALAATAQSPGGVSTGLEVWLKADAGTSSTTDNAYLDSWADQSPNGNDATQSTVSAKPQYQANQMNGNPVIKTTGPRYFDVDLSGIDNIDYTIFTVTKRQSANNFQHIIGVQQSGNYIGLCLGYSGSTLMRFFQYGNIASLGSTAYSSTNEIPTILAAQFAAASGKRLWHVRDGVMNSRSGTNKTHYSMTGQGRIGRGNDNYGFNGQIAEVIVYNRTLSDTEKRQVHTYLSVKYGLSVPVSEHLYYDESLYASDVFGIGKDLALSGLNQTASESVNGDDILRISDPSSLDDGDYMVCGNDDGSSDFEPYGGSNCTIAQTLGRDWKFNITGDPGTVTLRFDLSDIADFDSDELMLLIDDEGDGYDDETGVSGVYNAPYFEVSGLNISNESVVTLAQGYNTLYAVASGSTSAAIWALTPDGEPHTVSGICEGTRLIINTGVTVNNDWSSLTCEDFTIELGGIFNASNGTIIIKRDFTVNGTFNAQTSTIEMSGDAEQTIDGLSIANVYNLTLNNSNGLVIGGASGGVRARNMVNVTSGVITTNGRFTLISDISSTGMITSLVGGSIHGNVTVQRYHGAAAQGWVNLSSPVMDKTLQDWNDDLITTGFTGSDYPIYAFNNVQSYTESTAGAINTGYVGATHITNAIQSGKGYFVFMNAGVMNLDVDGTIHSGTMSLPVTFTNTGNAAADGWNLVGNPYPCTIDWNSSSWTKTNINNAVYVWNAATGQYASYVGGVSSNGGSRYIAPSQSFFVVANGAAPALTIEENCKVAQQSTFKSTELTEGMFTLSVIGDQYSDETTIARNPQATALFEPEFDAYKLRSPLTEAPYLSTISESGEDLSINVLSELTSQLIIPLRMEVGTSGLYTIAHKGLSSFANGACVVLEDLLTGAMYPLNLEDNIQVQLESGQQQLRFQLRISGAAISAVTSAGCPGVENGGIMITNNDPSPADITWMNGEGEEILFTDNLIGTKEISGLAAGTYYVSINQGTACGTTVAEVFISQDPVIYASSIVTPVSCTNDDDGGIAMNVAGGTGPYEVLWSNGIEGTTIESVEAGEYVAFVIDAKGCQAQFNVHVPVKSKLNAEFEILHDQIELMNGAAQVDFYNTSAGADSYEWNFGDATQMATESNPTHLYNAKGIYDVTLKVIDDDCESIFKKSVQVVSPKDDGSGLGSEIIGTLTDNGVQLMFYFDHERSLRITAYNVLGQQLIEPVVGNYERQTITFSERKYAANALIEIIDVNTGERALLRMGI